MRRCPTDDSNAPVAGPDAPAAGPDAAVAGRTRLGRALRDRLRPIAKELIHRAWTPGPAAKGALRAAYHGGFLAREAMEWARRSLVATPTFLALCDAHGERISVDRLPYMVGLPRLELGSDIRISGQIRILASTTGEPALRIGSGVFIGHGTTLAVRERIEIGDYCSIGGGCYIADTDGHTHARLDVPIWEDRADSGSTAPVVIEDNVHIARGCVLLKGVRVGARSILGAGAVVRSDVPPGSVVLGNPGRPAGWRRAPQRG